MKRSISTIFILISLKGLALPWGEILPLLLLSKQASSYYLVYSINQSIRF